MPYLLNNIIRKMGRLLVIVLAGLVVWYATLLWLNNRAVSSVDIARLSQSLDHAVRWLEDNVEGVEKHNNPPLWWMIKQSAETSRHPRLLSFYRKNEKDIVGNPSFQIWSPMFDPAAVVTLPLMPDLNYLPEYNYLFLHGLHCDVEWGESLIIQRQLDPGLCPLHFLNTRCVTHQLMGVRFMQRSNCDDQQRLASLVQDLQEIIVSELYWDPRVVDAYIQRILMLVESGAKERVKAVWIERFLEAQNSDGGWSNFDPIFRLSNNKAFGFTSSKLAYREVRSDLHATAQAIWLISLLLKH